MNCICPLAVVPVRADNIDRSEMVTQVLFGETFSVLSERNNWLRVRLHFDGYEGWVEKKQALPVSSDFFEKVLGHTRHILSARFAICTRLSDKAQFLIGKGSSLPLLKKGQFLMGEQRFEIHDKCRLVPKKFSAARVAAVAIEYLNTPYLWGGRSVAGIDCSGFVQVVMQSCGINLPRDASQQIKYGTAIDFVDEALPGDLAFFDNLDGKIVHVGLMLGTDKIIHSSGQVRIDHLDYNGIFRKDIGKYTHSLRIIKRLG